MCARGLKPDRPRPLRRKSPVARSGRARLGVPRGRVDKKKVCYFFIFFISF